MRKYIAVIAIEANDDVEKSEIVGAISLGTGTYDPNPRARIIGATMVPQVEPVRMRWSVTALGLERRELMVAWDGEQERGVVSIYDPRPVRGEVDVHSVILTPESMSQIIRGIAEFPIDMVDVMAARVARARRRGE